MINFVEYLESKINLSQKKRIVIYTGRFQPAGPHHIKAIQHLKDKFKTEIIYVLTSNPKKIDEKNPLSFEKKKKIFSTLGISPKRIIELKGSGYNIDHILKSIGRTKDNTQLILAFGQKDIDSGEKNLFDSPAFVKYKEGGNIPSDKAFLYVIPTVGYKQPASSTKIRNAINDKDTKKLENIYGSKAQRVLSIFNEAVNKHTSHLEDLLFEKGYKGYLEAINNLYNAYKILSGNKSNFSLSEKIDGSISILFGRDQESGKSFVSYKGGSKKAKSNKEIVSMYGDKPNLVPIFKKILKNLSPKASDAMYQGDLLWGDASQVSDAGDSWEFTANTIKYSINKKDMPTVPDIAIAVHTKYIDNKGTNSFDPQPLRQSGYFILDPKVKKVGFAIDKSLLTDIRSLMKEASSYKSVKSLISDEEVKRLLPIWINSRIRGEFNKTSGEDWDSFISTVSADYDKKASSVKTPKAKASWEAKKKALLSKLEDNRNAAVTFFNSYNKFINIKQKLLSTLKGKEQLKGSIDGKRTGEGWVLLSKGGKFVKLVDRNEFSRLNFNLSKNRKIEK